MRSFLQVCACTVLSAAIGCEGRGDNGRFELTGSVSYDGQPVEEGQIVFEPEAPGAPMATGQIKSGEYRIEPKYGPTAGPYRVRIEGYRQKKDPNPPPPDRARASIENPGYITEQYLPLDYNARTTLRIEFTVDGEKVHNFDLKSR